MLCGGGGWRMGLVEGLKLGRVGGSMLREMEVGELVGDGESGVVGGGGGEGG